MSEAFVDDLARVLDEFDRMVVAVQADQWEAPTPCTEWNVRDLIDHVIRGNLMFAGALRGDEPRTVDRSNMVRAFRAGAADLLAAFRLPGVLDKIVHLPFADVPGSVAVHFRTIECLVHGWDLARATGAKPDFPVEVAEREIENARAALARFPREGPFAPSQPVADDAPALDRLAALMGRTG